MDYLTSLCARPRVVKVPNKIGKMYDLNIVLRKGLFSNVGTWSMKLDKWKK